MRAAVNNLKHAMFWELQEKAVAERLSALDERLSAGVASREQLAGENFLDGGDLDGVGPPQDDDTSTDLIRETA